MKTRKELIVELVAGLGSLKNTAGKITHASELLAEIEKVCPEETQQFASVPVLPMDVQVAISDAVARARVEEQAAERERCARVAEAVPATCRASRDEVDGICEMVAAAIRRGGV